MAKLSNADKILIIERLAAFVSPTDVVKELQVEYKLDVTRQQVDAYDPATVAGKRLSEKFKSLFEQMRSRAITDIDGIPIASPAYRLRILDQIVRETPGATVRMAALEQAAKEIGGAYTNRRELTGLGGGAVQVENVTYTDAERAAQITAFFERLAAGGSGSDPAITDG